MGDEIIIKKETLWKYSTFVLAAALIIVLFVSFRGNDSSNSGMEVVNNPSAGTGGVAGRVEINIEDAPVLGSKNAPVTIVEFSDYQCPFCRKFWFETLPSIKKDYIDNGKVKLVYKDFPLGFHPGAMPYAQAARCAGEKGDDAYYKMHDKMYGEQNKLDGGTVQSTVEYPGAEILKRWAKEIGYDIGTCLDGGKYAEAVQQDLSDGGAAGVQGTPGFFVNGIEVSGAQPYSVFKQIIDAELQ